MKITICGSIAFFEEMLKTKSMLENMGHEVQLPPSELKNKEGNFISAKEYYQIRQNTDNNEDWVWERKKEAMNMHFNKVAWAEAVLVLNYDKRNISNYIGANTLMEMGLALHLNKKIYLLNQIPEIQCKEEVLGMQPIILNGNLDNINPRIEIEIRSFISKEQYEKLLELFKENAEFVKEDFQETHYFDCDEDLRIQKNNFGSKIWIKKGKIHDEAREEIEVKTTSEDFDKLGKIFSSIGFGVKIKWLRQRKQFNWDEIKVCLDYTKGYGHIIELETMGTEENKEQILIKLKEKLNELGIVLTPREEFENKYNYYKENWRELI